MDGGCTCGNVRYRLTDSPLIVHACHCTWCQRETGSAFVINLWMEARHVAVTGTPVAVTLASESGAGQVVYRCPDCQVAVFSQYSSGPACRFVRGGTLDDPSAVIPDVHIYTSTKLPWVQLGDDIPVFEGYYRRSEIWRPEAYNRYQAARAAAS
ncbi:MAG: GFA family protein [Pseudomonadota bacterium]